MDPSFSFIAGQNADSAKSDGALDFHQLLGCREDQSSVPVFYFDFSFFNFLPRPSKFSELRHQLWSGGVGRLNRKAVWNKHGRSMHWLTLEFADEFTVESESEDGGNTSDSDDEESEASGTEEEFERHDDVGNHRRTQGKRRKSDETSRDHSSTSLGRGHWFRSQLSNLFLTGRTTPNAERHRRNSRMLEGSDLPHGMQSRKSRQAYSNQNGPWDFVTEGDFAEDYLRRNKKFATYGSGVLAVGLSVWLIADLIGNEFDFADTESILILGPMFLLQYCVFTVSRKAAYRMFQPVLLIFALFGSGILAFHMVFVMRTTESQAGSKTSAFDQISEGGNSAEYHSLIRFLRSELLASSLASDSHTAGLDGQQADSTTADANNRLGIQSPSVGTALPQQLGPTAREFLYDDGDRSDYLPAPGGTKAKNGAVSMLLFLVILVTVHRLRFILLLYTMIFFAGLYFSFRSVQWQLCQPEVTGWKTYHYGDNARNIQGDPADLYGEVGTYARAERRRSYAHYRDFWKVVGEVEQSISAVYGDETLTRWPSGGSTTENDESTTTGGTSSWLHARHAPRKLFGYMPLDCSEYVIDEVDDGGYLSIIFSALLLLVSSYSLEVLQRKDFIQATMVLRESKRSEALLRNILPEKIIARLKKSYTSISEKYEETTILFTHIAEFNDMAACLPAGTLVDFLNRMFYAFDAEAERNRVEKIKTIGDGYMAAAGVPEPNVLHAKTMARFALNLIKITKDKGMEFLPADARPDSRKTRPTTKDSGYYPQTISVRIGLHSGSCVGGVIGQKKFAFDMWGDAVNTASRMESSGETNKAHCTEQTMVRIMDDFRVTNAGIMNVKGKGPLQTYWIEEQFDEQKIFATARLEELRTKELADALDVAKNHLNIEQINQLIASLSMRLRRKERLKEFESAPLRAEYSGNGGEGLRYRGDRESKLASNAREKRTRGVEIEMHAMKRSSGGNHFRNDGQTSERASDPIPSKDLEEDNIFPILSGALSDPLLRSGDNKPPDENGIEMNLTRSPAVLKGFLPGTLNSTDKPSNPNKKGN